MSFKPDPPTIMESNTSNIHKNFVPDLDLGNAVMKNIFEIEGQLSRYEALIQSYKQQMKEEDDPAEAAKYLPIIAYYKKQLQKFKNLPEVKKVLNTVPQKKTTGNLAPTVNGPSTVLKSRRARRAQRRANRKNTRRAFRKST